MPSLIVFYALAVLAILVAFLVIVLVNLAVLPNFEAEQVSGDGTVAALEVPKAAVLLPARNEEANIEACLDSLLAQDYPNLEVWVYNDVSTDSTAAILSAIQSHNASASARLHVIDASADPPPGWLGKAHACYRLYEAMRAESDPDYLLFTDADVRFKPTAVSRAVATARRLSSGLLSIYPRQITVSWAERLAVPLLLHGAVYTFLPLPLAFASWTPPAFAAANGQFMLFTRAAYEKCGGHAAVRSQILEDVALARAVRRAGYRAMLADSGSLVHTRMYDGPEQVWEGFSKNAYAFFGYSPLWLALAVIALLVLYVAPPLLAVGYLPSAPVIALIFLAQYFVAVLTRLVLAVRFKYRLADSLLHPIAILYAIAIELNSMIWARKGHGEWKGRGVNDAASRPRRS